MPDIQVNQTSAPPPPSSPPPDDRNSPIWPLMIALLVVVILIVGFIVTRSDRPAAAEKTDIQISLPDTPPREIQVPDTIEVDVPDKIEVDLPDKVDVDINAPPQEPPPQPENPRP
ncbi:MAG TPA: hypothetical protein VMT00_14800 [Thermoanaerobaculia bacterium]|nr:hypothetical protein [Thermoanaerobaculia bacterium]